MALGVLHLNYHVTTGACHVEPERAAKSSIAGAWMQQCGFASSTKGVLQKKRSKLGFSSNAETFTCFCTVCNAIKFLNIRGSSTGPSKHVVKGSDGRKWDASQILAVGEGICLSAAVASHVVCLLHAPPQQIQHQSAAPPCEPPRALFKSIGLPTWQLVPLWIALLINILLRAVQPQQAAARAPAHESALVQRVAKLEEDLGNSVTIIRALTRQLEKLVLRVQVTRRTLQDPIQETATLAGNATEAVKVLASRETLLEEEIEETRRALFSIQEQQAKQLELIAKLVSNSRKLEDRLVKKLVAKPAEARKPDIKDDYKYDFWLSNGGGNASGSSHANRDPVYAQGNQA